MTETALINDRDGALNDLTCAVAAVAVFSVASLACAVFSDGFLTADALTHYLYARYAFREPYLLADVWGRPFVTALYALPAALVGRLAVRATALLCAIVCSVTAWKIAEGQGVRRPALALLFTLAQPLVFLNSFAEMTELPFAALAGLAFWMYQSRRWLAAAVLVSMTPLARPEGFELIALAAIAFAAQRRLLPLVLLPLPLVLWNYAGWEQFGRHGPWWRWLTDNWPYARESAYPAGSVLQFVATLPVVVGPILLPATLAGIGRALARTDDADRHLRICRLLTPGIPLSILVVHSLLYRLGKLASYGEPRYLLVAAPFWAVLSAWGWQWMSDRLGVRHPLWWAAVACVAPAAALVAQPVLPLRAPAHWARAKAFADGYRQRLAGEGYPRVIAAHPAVFYYLDVSPTDKSRVVEWRREFIAAAPAGTVLLWDPIYGPRNAHGDRAVTLEEVRSAGWVPLPEVDETLARTGVEDSRPAPDPEDRLQVEGGWHAFRTRR